LIPILGILAQRDLTDFEGEDAIGLWAMILSAISRQQPIA
jgi:hypothetical protein